MATNAAAAGVKAWMWRESGAAAGWKRRKPKGCPIAFFEKDGYRMGYAMGDWHVFLIDDPNAGTDDEDRVYADAPDAGAAMVEEAVASGCRLEVAAERLCGGRH